MIHLVTQTNAHLYETEITQLHRVRKAVFIDELGWQLASRDGLEFDEYDDERASNIIGFSATGEVVMGLRFRPADDRSMLADHFPQVLPAGMRPLDDGRTWELSRGFCVERGVKAQDIRRKAACMIAPLEIALHAGIDRCVGFTDVRMLDFCYGVGWKLTLLGAPMNYGEGDAVAYELDVSQSSLDDMRRMWGLPEPAFVTVHALRPGEANVHEAAARLANENPALLRIAARAAVDKPQSEPVEATGAERYYSTFQNSG